MISLLSHSASLSVSATPQQRHIVQQCDRVHVRGDVRLPGRLLVRGRPTLPAQRALWRARFVGGHAAARMHRSVHIVYRVTPRGLYKHGC